MALFDATAGYSHGRGITRWTDVWTFLEDGKKHDANYPYKNMEWTRPVNMWTHHLMENKG